MANFLDSASHMLASSSPAQAVSGVSELSPDSHMLASSSPAQAVSGVSELSPDGLRSRTGDNPQLFESSVGNPLRMSEGCVDENHAARNVHAGGVDEEGSQLVEELHLVEDGNTDSCTFYAEGPFPSTLLWETVSDHFKNTTLGYTSIGDEGSCWAIIQSNAWAHYSVLGPFLVEVDQTLVNNMGLALGIKRKDDSIVEFPIPGMVCLDVYTNGLYWVVYENPGWNASLIGDDTSRESMTMASISAFLGVNQDASQHVEGLGDESVDCNLSTQVGEAEGQSTIELQESTSEALGMAPMTNDTVQVPRSKPRVQRPLKQPKLKYHGVMEREGGRKSFVAYFKPKDLPKSNKSFLTIGEYSNKEEAWDSFNLFAFVHEGEESCMNMVDKDSIEMDAMMYEDSPRVELLANLRLKGRGHWKSKSFPRDLLVPRFRNVKHRINTRGIHKGKRRWFCDVVLGSQATDSNVVDEEKHTCSYETAKEAAKEADRLMILKDGHMAWTNYSLTNYMIDMEKETWDDTWIPLQDNPKKYLSIDKENQSK